ncbi:hypothetical protein KC347_g153 [Hortaea werneckii]|nr:hypothetical protein KC347_g153 [Hortaea werneckii]
MGRLIASKRRTKRHLHLLCPSRGSANAHGDSPSPNSKRDEAVDAGRRLVSNPGGFPLARRAVHPNIPLLYVSTLHLPPHPSRIVSGGCGIPQIQQPFSLLKHDAAIDCYFSAT